MKKRGIGTYLAQGAAANAVAAYLLLLGLVLYAPNSEIDSETVILIVLPAYLLVAGIVGAVIASMFWLASILISRRLGILVHAAVGILLPGLIVVRSTYSIESGFDLNELMILAIPALVLSLPAALLSGSNFNPLRSVVFGLDPAASDRDFAHGFSFPPALLLRVGSLLGLMEALLYLASLPSSALANWDMSDPSFVKTIVAVLYFAVTALVSFDLPRKSVVVAAAVLANTPLAIWAMDPQLFTTMSSGFLAFTVWVFMYVWVLFVVGRMLCAELARPRPLRILPVTMLEIRMRHAFNLW